MMTENRSNRLCPKVLSSQYYAMHSLSGQTDINHQRYLSIKVYITPRWPVNVQHVVDVMVMSCKIFPQAFGRKSLHLAAARIVNASFSVSVVDLRCLEAHYDLPVKLFPAIDVQFLQCNRMRSLDFLSLRSVVNNAD